MLLTESECDDYSDLILCHVESHKNALDFMTIIITFVKSNYTSKWHITSYFLYINANVVDRHLKKKKKIMTATVYLRDPLSHTNFILFLSSFWIKMFQGKICIVLVAMTFIWLGFQSKNRVTDVTNQHEQGCDLDNILHFAEACMHSQNAAKKDTN